MTHEPLTDKELAEIQARADAATEGPWQYMHNPYHRSIGRDESSVVFEIAYGAGLATEPDPNGVFAAHARQDIPKLLAAVDERDKEIARLKERVVELEEELVNAQKALKLFGNLDHEKCP